MNKKHRAEINAFYEMYKKKKGAENESNSFRISDEFGLVESETKSIGNSGIDNRKSTCGGKMKRVIEWEGIATSSNNNGWCGKSGGNAI